MGKEVLATDIDEVFYPFLDAFIPHHDELYDSQLQREHFKTYEFHGPLGVSVPETVKRIYEFMALDDDHIEPIEESREALRRLSKVFDIVAVTARHEQFEANTRRWLKSKFDTEFHSLHMIGFAPIMEKPIKKVDVCREIGAIALVDDSLSHILECAEADIEGILFGDYPWNQADELHPKVTRCVNWPKVADHFNA